MAKPLRVLIAWELGAHLGHVMKLKPIVMELLARGHQVTLVVPDVKAARPHITENEKLQWEHGPSCSVPDDYAPGSYAEMIECCVLPSDAAATQFALTWQRLMARARPDTMLAEHAPGALLAARLHQLPLLHLADGWSLPPVGRPHAELVQLPLLEKTTSETRTQAFSDASKREGVLVARINSLLKQVNVGLLKNLGDLYSGASVSLLCTFPELDHFGARRHAKYVGPLSGVAEGVALRWPDRKVDADLASQRRRVFVYLQPHPTNIALLRLLRSLGADVIAYLPQAKPEAVKKFNSARTQISALPVCMDLILGEADLVVSNGGHGLLCTSLLAGVPLLVLPTQREQALLALRSSATGAVFAASQAEFGVELQALASQLLENPQARQAALAFARKYSRHDSSVVVRKIANTLEKLSLNGRTTTVPTAASFTAPLPLAQIEITTKCNFECFYCAGRHMKQENMPWERFEQVLERLGSLPHKVSLQGEGEPTAHPEFWRMVDRVIALGHQPYTITNASLIDVPQTALKFASIGVSLDTLDEAEAQRIGRYKLPNVLARLQALVQEMGPERVTVHTVAYGQELGPVASFVQALGTEHLVQPLQTKPDYARHYAAESPVTFWQHAKQCQYLEQPLMRYFAVDGREAPCCYIKDMSMFDTAQHLRTELAEGKVPATCIGCREIATPRIEDGRHSRSSMFVRRETQEES